MLLQTGLGAPTLALAAAVALAVVGAYAALVYWVYSDATARGSERPTASALHGSWPPPSCSRGS